MSCKGVAQPVFVCALRAALFLALSACSVDFKDGVFTCTIHADCPPGLHCDSRSKRCTRQPYAMTEAGVMTQPDGAVHIISDSGAATSDAGQRDPRLTVEQPADAAMPEAGAEAGRSRPGEEEASPASADAGRPRAAGGAKAEQPAAAGSSGAEHPAAAGSGGVAGSAGTGGSAGGSGSAPPGPQTIMPTACPPNAYCYGFESGALDPSGALWPSPSDGSGGLPPTGELTTSEYPASSRNMVLVSRPSANGSWPKATVGFSGPRTPFDRLVVSFDYTAGDTLVEPNPRVILFRFVGTPARNGDSVNIGLLANAAMLEVQTSGADTLESIGPAAAPGNRTHVMATFERSQTSCTVTVAYGDAPLQAAAFPCEVERWQIELGLDMLETPPDQYTQNYVAYFDDLRVITTP